MMCYQNRTTSFAIDIYRQYISDSSPTPGDSDASRALRGGGAARGVWRKFEAAGTLATYRARIAPL